MSDRYDEMTGAELAREAVSRGWSRLGVAEWSRPTRPGETGGECVMCVAWATAYRGAGLDPCVHTGSPTEALRVALRWDDEDGGAQTDDRPTTTRVELTPAQMERLAAAGWPPPAGGVAMSAWLTSRAEDAARLTGEVAEARAELQDVTMDPETERDISRLLRGQRDEARAEVARVRRAAREAIRQAWRSGYLAAQDDARTGEVGDLDGCDDPQDYMDEAAVAAEEADDE